MIYRILKFIISVGIRLYYKEIRVQNKERLPKSGPVILLANHPNTVMDGWVLGRMFREPLHFMAKGTFFNSRFKKWLLTSLKLIPINRASESKTEGVNNVESFSKCFELLDKQGMLVIFPEGSSYKERVLREIKTGAARIALEFVDQHKGKSNLKIVNVGLNYSQAERFRSRILVNVADVIELDDVYREGEKYNKEDIVKLTEEIRKSLESVLITSNDKFQDELLEKLHALYTVDKSVQSGVRGKMTELKEISSMIEAIAITRPYALQEIDILADEINTSISQLGIKSAYLKRGGRIKSYLKQLIGSVFLLIIGLPIYLFGLIHNFLPYKITDLIIPKLTKDIEYHAPLGILIGIILYPLTYYGFAKIGTEVFLFQGWYLVLYVALIPACGLFAIMFHKNMTHVLHKWKFYLMLKNKKVEIEKLKAKYQVLSELLEL